MNGRIPVAALLAALALAGATALALVGQSATLALPRPTEAQALAALAAHIDALAAADRFSGIVLVARHGRVLLEKTAGYADRDTRTPVTRETRFRLGSMNKMFTAIATLQLVEAGRLSLDDRIGTHIPDYPNAKAASTVTIRHLLTHTGGTGDIFGGAFEQNRATLRDHADYLTLFGARDLTHEPGTRHRYSNYGFILLGAIVERVTGLSYYDAVRRSVFEPAGMADTDSLPEHEAVPNRSTGYTRRGDRWVSNAAWLPWRGTAAGGGYSTAHDLLRFAQALENGTLLSRKFLAQATRPQPDNYGYGFRTRGLDAGRWYGHGGGAPGMNGDLRIYPSLGLIVIALANLDPPAASQVVEFLTQRMPETRSSP